MQSDKDQRLNKFLALQLGISRREADDLIEKKSVKINDQIAELGQRVSIGDIINVNGKQIDSSTQFVYLALHKPAGYVCSRKRQGDTPTIYELLPKEYHQLKPVGRLDKDSSGMILLTNDGDFAHQMTHPSFHKVKIYEVTLDNPLQPLHQQMISDFGVILEDGKSQFLIEKTEQAKTYKITMSEGRNRQIRRTFAALGYSVARLHREQFGNYQLNDLASGHFAETSAAL
ncbi:MAG TPA: pseudouridine synthase [Candidatus Saccharimonadales bacterium]